MESIQHAAEHLSRSDPIMAKLVERFGLFTPEPHTDYYYELVSSIISQQLSVKAAATIEKRFVDLFGGMFPTPEQIIATDIEQLRGVGLSRAKASYVIDLAHHVRNGELKIDALPRMANEDIIKELVAVKGIGEWTAHMFLIFALGRLDVLPVGDLGVRAAIKNQYGLAALPTPALCREIALAKHWRPYESVAAWYLWRSLDNS